MRMCFKKIIFFVFLSIPSFLKGSVAWIGYTDSANLDSRVYYKQDSTNKLSLGDTISVIADKHIFSYIVFGINPIDYSNYDFVFSNRFEYLTHSASIKLIDSIKIRNNFFINKYKKFYDEAYFFFAFKTLPLIDNVDTFAISSFTYKKASFLLEKKKIINHGVGNDLNTEIHILFQFRIYCKREYFNIIFLDVDWGDENISYYEVYLLHNQQVFRIQEINN